MAPYLFFIGVGTYDTYTSEVEYPNGNTFAVELLALPGVIDKASDAASALKSLVDSVLWTCVSCGPEKYDHTTERDRIYELLPKRDALKLADPSSTELVTIRAELAALMSAWTHTGYQYTGTCYREIGMENSNYGGMENVGNTTIVSSRLTPSRWLVDGGLVYMEGVKVHEFYHNINGSQVTGDTPFEIWLNEAVTVHVQREREDVIFGRDYMRLGHVIYARMPGNGPLALDRAPSSMAVEPAGFNTTHELISAMTYSKAPEFVRMTQSIIGEENFVKALANYYSKYAYSNATSSQWVDEMAAFQPANVDLKRMAKGWLQRTSYPTVTVDSRDSLDLTLTQTGFEGKKDDDSPWVIPVAWSAVKDGKEVAAGTWIFQTASETFKVTGVASADDFDFISVGCDWSFYGDVLDKSQTPATRLKQAMTDPDVINRFLAFAAIVDEEKAKLVEGFRAGVTDGLIAVTDGVLDLYGSILNDESLSDATKARFLSIGDDVASRPELGHLYWHLSQAKTAILQAVGAKFAPKLKEEFARLSADSQLTTRPLKQAVFAAIRAAKSSPMVVGAAPSKKDEEARLLAGRIECSALLKPLMDSDFMSDRAFAFINLIELGGEEGKKAMADAKDVWCKHSIGTEQYITCVAAADSSATPANIRALLTEPFFKIELAGHARTVARAWCGNRKRAMLTAEGLELSKYLFTTIGHVNFMSAFGFIGTFGQIGQFEPSVKSVLVQAVRDMRESVKDVESLYNQLGRLLGGAE